MENVFDSYSSNKGLITRIYRELKKLNSQRINKPMKKWEHELNRQFSKEEVQMTNKYMKKYSTALAIKEMQIKTTLTLIVKMAIIKNTNNNFWQGYSETGTFIHYWQECKLVQTL
jgi:hypothetical protein